ncbi:MAG: hypothetical protein JJU18_00515, partial [Oceanicaulis sp.]|nr:hypothetical protein [Oceanicaulis sp.]
MPLAAFISPGLNPPLPAGREGAAHYESASDSGAFEALLTGARPSGEADAGLRRQLLATASGQAQPGADAQLNPAGQDGDNAAAAMLAETGAETPASDNLSPDLAPKPAAIEPETDDLAVQPDGSAAGAASSDIASGLAAQLPEGDTPGGRDLSKRADRPDQTAADPSGAGSPAEPAASDADMRSGAPVAELELTRWLEAAPEARPAPKSAPETAGQAKAAAPAFTRGAGGDAPVSDASKPGAPEPAAAEGAQPDSGTLPEGAQAGWAEAEDADGASQRAHLDAAVAPAPDGGTPERRPSRDPGARDSVTERGAARVEPAGQSRQHAQGAQNTQSSQAPQSAQTSQTAQPGQTAGAPPEGGEAFERLMQARASGEP